MSTSGLVQLSELLGAIASGPVTDKSSAEKIEQILADCWDLLTGDCGGMAGWKLLRRMEDICWNPPFLTFVIERHGGASMGSTRAELQKWTIDINEATATYDRKSSFRQLVPNAPRLNVVPLAEKAVAMILADQDGECLKWSKDRGRVTIRTGKLIPAEDTVLKTLTGRRRRLGKKLKELLEDAGRRLVEGTSPHTYEKAPKASSHS